MTRRRKHRAAHPGAQAPAQPDIGLVSIPLLCCLLGAALFVYEFGGSAPTLTNEFIRLEESVAASAFNAFKIDEREKAAAAKLQRLEQAARLARIRREIEALLARHTALEEQKQDLDRLETLLAEIEAARLRLDELELQKQKAIVARQSLFGGYTGQYVLVECLAGEVIVHPSERRISLNALTAQRDWLLGEIDRVGYVAIAVRPGGWTRDSFETAKGLIQEHIESQRLNHGRAIAHTDFPLHADEAIGPYLPPPAS